VERRPVLLERATARLADLAKALHGREYLEGRFTAGDLLMATVLRIPRHTGLVAGFPALATYLARCEARPAFGRALAAQLAVFERHAPPAS
jgi:glutathione S-transferase